MKFLKQPFAAIALSVTVVIASTIASVDVKLTGRCEEVTEEFYSGTRYRGTVQPSIASMINELLGISNQLVPIAENYGIDVTSLDSSGNALRQSLAKSVSVKQIYESYEFFADSLRQVETKLHAVGLSERHAVTVQELDGCIDSCIGAIESSVYNENVRIFLRSNDRFPASLWAEVLGIDYPEYFS